MLPVEQLRALACYYREIISSLSYQSGRHLIDLGANMRYGLTVDLGPYLPRPSVLIEEDAISFRVERVSPEAVSDVVDLAGRLEESAEDEANRAALDERNVKSALTARLIAIYRKQQQDPFNRETILGYPIVAGRYGSIKFCAPVLYFPVNVQYDPVKSIFSIKKQFEAPTLNSHLLVKLTGSEDEATAVRREIVPYLYQAEFDCDALEKIILALAEFAPGLKGLKTDHRAAAPLADVLEARTSSSSTLFKTAVLVNAKRTGAFLQDDLAELSKLNAVSGETVVDTLLADVAENIEEPTDSVVASDGNNPLLFPLQSNKAQRVTARKAERAKLLVVQGPPGTGKSQTITNLICHLTACGHTVLVTSHQNKALEVITQMLPQIDYLAMSLLKGEKESVSQLANQLERFSATVEGKTVAVLEQFRARAVSKLRECDMDLGRLTARFAELKLLEREHAAPYRRYDDVREYNHIHPDDAIPLGADGAVTQALLNWHLRVREVQPHLEELTKAFGDHGTDPKAVAASSRTLQDLVTIFGETARLAAGNEYVLDFARAFVKEDGLSADDRTYLTEWSRWLSKSKRNIFASLHVLRDVDSVAISIKSLLHQAQTLGTEYVHHMVREAERVTEDASHLLQIWPPPRDLPARPSEEHLVSAQNAVNELSARAGGWFSWHLSPPAIASRKTLQTLGLGTVTYRERSVALERLNNWIRAWKLRTSVVTSLVKLRQLGAPLNELEDDSSAAALGKGARAGLSFASLLAYLSSSPQGPTSRVHREIIERHVCGLETDANAVVLIEALQETEKYLARIDAFADVVGRAQFANLSELPNRYLRAVLRSVQYGGNILGEYARWEKLLRLADTYRQILTIEATAMSCIPRTIRELRKSFLSGNQPDWLSHPELAVEAYRLSAFVRDDLAKDPDDIQGIASRLKDANKLKQSLVEDVIRRSRLVSLKRAELDNASRSQIVRLRQLLRRKKKTPSLLQLRNQIEYQRLLQVFPCWIMSIEDVARIFPLQAGLFEYLIVDEASQCNQATTLHLAYRAKRLAVVGDRQQLKNANVRFLSDNLVRMLLSKYGLDEHPRADFLHGRESLLALSEVAANSASFLNEHFRCEPPIITWSNDNFYAGRLRILTPIRPRRFVPVAEVHLVTGADDDPELRINRIEAQAVIAEVKRLITSGEADGLDIGIISPYEPQATLLNNLLHEAFSSNPQALQQHRLTASTADGFQGDERDIILYSFRFGPSSSPGVVRAIELERERLNVAFSRARRKVVSFISRPADSFPHGLIRSFIEHSLEIQRQSRGRLSAEVTDKFESEFERRVCETLRNRGVSVLTQVPCAGFFIDLVALDNNGRRLAIECDGEFHYDDDNDLRPEDYQRQDIIERSGWAVYRISTRRFYTNPVACIEEVLQELKAQPAEADLIGGDITPNVEEQEEIPVPELPRPILPVWCIRLDHFKRAPATTVNT